MKRVSKFVVNHKLLEWTPLILSTMPVVLLCGARNQLEQFCLFNLTLEIKKHVAIQLMAQTLKFTRGRQTGGLHADIAEGGMSPQPTLAYSI